MSEIDPIEFGKVIASIEHLSDSVPLLSDQMTKLTARITELENKMSTGKGVFLGLTMAAGSAGALVHQALNHMLGKG